MFRLWKIFDALINDVDGSKIHDNSIPDSKLMEIDGSKIKDRSISHIKLIEGHGSGLDADTVDGIQGSQIVKNDQPNTIRVSSTPFGLVLSSSYLFNAQLTSGFTVDPNSGGWKSVVYTASLDGEFAIYERATEKVVLRRKGDDLLYNSNKVWHSGDFSYVNESNQAQIELPNSLKIVSYADTYYLSDYQVTIDVSSFLNNELIIPIICGCEYPAYVTEKDTTGRKFTVLVKASSQDESVVIQWVVIGF